MNFEANEVSADYNDYGILVIYFGCDTNYLTIQFNEEPDDYSIQFGMDTYHIERDDQSYGGYGGVKNWILTDESIKIELDEKGKKTLQTNELVITFKLDEEALVGLREKLEIAFDKL